MRTPFLQAGLVVVAVLLANLALGADFFVATITATSGNSTVSSALTAPAQYSLQCTSNARYRVCATNACTATVTDFLVPSAGMDVPMTTAGPAPAAYIQFIAVYADGANTTCSLFRVTPPTLPGVPP